MVHDNTSNSKELEEIENLNFTPELAKELLGLYNSGNRDNIFKATRLIRQVLAREENPPLEIVVQCGFVPYICTLASPTNNDVEVLQEAIWTVTNILSGPPEYTKMCCENGVVGNLVPLLEHNTPFVKELTSWALGNIAGDRVEYRDYVLEMNAMNLMLNNLRNADNSQIDLIKTTVWAISNLFRGKPFPTNYFEVILPVISDLMNCGIKEVITDTLWILSYITDCKDSEAYRIDKVLQLGLLPKIISQLSSDTVKALIPCIRVIGNICSGTEEQTEEVLKTNFLDYIPKLLKNERRLIRKETTWTISNIAAGTPTQIAKMFHPNILKGIIEGLGDNEPDVVRESCWVINNMVEGSNDDQFDCMIEGECIPALIELFECSDAKVLKIVLLTLELILERGDERARLSNDVNPYVYAVEAYPGALADLENLQSHKNQEIYDMVTDLLENYFLANVDVENIDISDDNNYDFS